MGGYLLNVVQPPANTTTSPSASSRPRYYMSHYSGIQVVIFLSYIGRLQDYIPLPIKWVSIQNPGTQRGYACFNYSDVVSTLLSQHSVALSFC